MSEHAVLDVSDLPDHAFGSRSTPWWGTLGFIVAESATLLLCAATYLYVGRNFDSLLPAGLAPPSLAIGTASMLLLLGSLIPAARLHHAARRKDDIAIVRLLVIAVVFELAALTLRAIEFANVGVRWDTNAYGSAVWFTLGFHALLLATDLVETTVFAAIFLTKRVEEKHYGDVADVAIYWYFVVFGWLPLYALLYLSPLIL